MSKYQSSSRVEQYLLHRLGKVIVLGGWVILGKTETIRNAFCGRIVEIAKLAIKLDSAIKEGITSQDLDAYFTADETVSCTCELGLKSSDDKRKTARILLKAGVVVPSALV
ncbi:uncharacterized protein BT62DRAFT_1013749 [Guyanagaster necrorhizus]|uniref:Uncharacterized protein n=1 Tax=Guyanagaster necrorhizus TaxID=856835 RepID=A0A9P7VFG4_9AGAR|nr:uncharacterized protein BT62DRAFT_1013749 [Guyanagaster necrorhizus MCA 3950]KAG7439602.1 hypothetical protein BT62DRAFT_1013749 [Guyanagaster necrorhizus MCA 3950]